MRDLSGTGQVYRFTLSQLLKSRANRVTLIIMVLLAAVSMPLTALLGGETPETSDTAGLTSVRVDNRTDLILDFSGDAYWADTDFSADAGEPDAVVTVTGDETGYQVAVVGSESAHAGELSQLAETARQAVRDACLQAAGLSSRQLEALTASTGEEDSHEDGFWVQYGYSILAMILCLMSASYVIRAVVEEKDSRLVELLLVSVKPMALLAGKILAVMAFTFGWLLAMLAGFGVSCGLTAGLMGSGVLQKQLHQPGVTLPLLEVLKGVGRLTGLFSVPAMLEAAGLLLAGFLLYCSLSAIGGSMAGKAEDLSSTNVLFSLVLVASFFCCMFAGGMDGMTSSARWLDYVPFTAILVTPSRVLLGQTSLLGGLVSLALVVVCAGVLTALAGQVYRLMSLYKGNPPTPRRVLRMLREK